MAIQVLIGCLVSIVNIVIHALITVTVVSIARRADLSLSFRRKLHVMTVMAAAAMVLLVGHLLEVAVWAGMYWTVGVAPAGTDLVDFAFVNYTTLGSGDVTPVKAWHLLGPMTAMNGVLMFGWSTAVLFEVLVKALARHEAVALSGEP